MRIPMILSFVLACATAQAAVNAPVLKWQQGGCTSWCQTGWYASPAVADLDSDGTREVVWSAYSVFVVRGTDGSLVWSAENGHDVTGGGSSVGRTWPGVAIADIDQDGALEIVTAHSDGFVSAYDATGHFKPGWPRQVTPGAELRTLALYDVDGDGFIEIGIGGTRSADQWFLLNHDGTTRPGWPQLPSGLCCAAGLYNENIAFGDLDGDGVAELVGPNDTHYVDAFYADGRSVPANQMFGSGKYWRDVGVWIPLAAEIRGYGNCGTEHRPNWNSGGLIVVDLDGDGTNEVVGCGNVHDCSTSPYTDLFEQLFIWKGDRSRWQNGTYDWTVVPSPSPGSTPLSEDYNVIETSEPNVVAADLDGDGEMEILYASYDGRMHCYKLDQSIPGNWPLAVTNPAEGFFRFASEPAVVDLDGDGSAEVIFGSWPQKSSLTVGFLHIADKDGNELHRVPVPSAPGDWNGILAAPTIDDIDGDSDLEAVVGTSATGIVAYDLPGTSQARVLWGTGRGNYQRSGGYLAYPLLADFDASPKMGPPPLSVAFTDKSSGRPTSFLWDFGDGASSTQQNPTHIYQSAGLYTVSITISDASSSDTKTRVNLINVTTNSPGSIVAGPGPSKANPNQVRRFLADGQPVSQFYAYGAKFGTNVAMAAIRQASQEILTGPGPGPVLGPQVRGFATDGTPIAKVSFYAYGTLRFGVGVAGGDMDQDGFDEILSAAGSGAVFGPHVRGFNFDGTSLSAIGKISFFAFGTLKYGANGASGDIDGDGYEEILAGAGPGSIFAATLRGFNYDGTSLTAMGRVNFNAFSTNYGADVATGDPDGDGIAEIIAGTGPAAGNPARLRGFNTDGGPLAPLTGFDQTPFATSYGVRVGSAELTGSGPNEVQAGAGPDPAAAADHRAYLYDGSSLALLSLSDFSAYPALSYGLEVTGELF